MPSKNNPEPAAQPKWDSYTPTDNKADVLRFLEDGGWDIKSSSFYTMKLAPNKHGLFTKLIVKNFVKREQILFLGASAAGLDNDLATRKAEAEINKLETQGKREQFKLDVEMGKFIARDSVELELASRLVVLDSGLEFLFRSSVNEMIAIVGGDADKAPLLLDYCLKEKDERMNTFGRMDNFIIKVEAE